MTQLKKKHYEAIAEVLRINRSLCKPNPTMQTAIDGVAGSMANYFATENPKFDRKKFLKLCGFEE